MDFFFRDYNLRKYGLFNIHPKALDINTITQTFNQEWHFRKNGFVFGRLSAELFNMSMDK